MLRLIDRWEAEGLVSSKQEAFVKIREHLFRELISGRHEKIDDCQSRSITQAENACEYRNKTLQLLMIDPVSLLKRLEKMGILKYVFPEIEHLKGVVQSPWQHMEGDVYAHTLLALQKLKEHYPDASRIEVLGVLLHDTGKPATRSVDEQGRITFYRHEEVGAEIAMDFCSRFSLDEGTAKGVTFW